MRKLVVIGAGEPALEVLDLIENENNSEEAYRVIGCFDEYVQGPSIYNALEDIPAQTHFINVIGNVFDRQRLYQSFIAAQFAPASILSASAWISPRAELAAGLLVYPKACISARVKIEEDVVINYLASVSHGAVIGAHSNLCPGVRVAGNARIGKRVYLGIGSVVREKITICDDVIIGANTTVVKDITAPGVYIGTPNRLLRPLDHD